MPELPQEIWKDRIENELRNIKNLEVLEDNSIIRHENNVELIIIIKALGFIVDGVNLNPQRSHRVFLKINRSFPYPGGIDFSWFSEIYHPNIHPVNQGSFAKESGTGYICLNVLKKWSRLSDLETTVKALELLIENPNPDDPLNYPICLEAAEFFRNNSMDDLKKEYSLVGLTSEEKEGEDEDDEIIILED